MTVKALRKQLMAAIAMVVVAAVALSSSTYAWFASNNTVSAEGANIAVTSDVATLLISRDKTTASEIQAQNKTIVDLSTSDATKLKPAQHGTVSGAGSSQTITAITAGDGVTAFDWYTQDAESATAPTGKVGSATQLAGDDFGEYVLKYDLYMTVAKNSNPVKDIKVSAATLTGDTAVKALIVGETNSVEFSGSSNTPSSILNGTNVSLTDAEVLHVELYIFYDGTAENIYTNNIPNIADTVITVSFSCVADV